MFIIFRWLIYMMGSWSLLLFFFMAATGIAARRGDRPFVVDWHQSGVNGKIGLIRTTVGIIVLVMAFIPLLPPLDRSLWYVKLHLYVCVPIFSISFIAIKVRFSGLQSKARHKFFAYPCIVSGAASNILGMCIAHATR